MISERDLRRVAPVRLRDARALLAQRRYGAASYVSGYTLEIMLKSRICHTLKWAGFPETRKEFEGYSSFRTHDLDVLLQLSGRAPRILPTLSAAWAVVVKWTPELRYSAMEPSQEETRTLLEAIEVLIRHL